MDLKKLYYSTLGGIHKNVKLLYYLRGLCLLMVPRWFCRQRAKLVLRRYEDLPVRDQSSIAERVEYYCQCSQTLGAEEHSDAIPELSSFPALKDNNFRKRNCPYASALARRKRRLAGPLPFFFDTYEYTRCFPQTMRWNVEGGDVNTEMPVPTVTKSRPIPMVGQVSNNVLLNLNKIRHFIFVHDPFRWEEKQAKVLFRGVVRDKPRRQRFVEMWASHPMCDIKDACDLTIYDHLKYRYIMALEGNDVASNLKWIMSSNSIAVMPCPTCETWFMEGRLIPGVHFIEIASDYHDLIEKVEYYEKHPEKVFRIMDNAHQWVSQFKNKEREEMISLLVMDKYLYHFNR